MAEEEDTKKTQPSLPPNYVSIVHLQEQWLKKKQKQKEDEEAAKQKQIEIATEWKKQELAAEKQIRDTQKNQRQGNYVQSSGKVEKSNLGRFQGSDGPGYSQRRLIDGNYEKGVYKDRGKGKIGEVGEKGVDSVLCRMGERADFERCGGKVRTNGGVGGGGGGFQAVMSLRVVAMEEGEIVGVKKRDDGFRGGLTSNVGDLLVNNDVSEKLGEGETMVETKEGLERGKKGDDGAMRVGHKKNVLYRPSQVNKGDLLVNFGDSDHVGRREGVEETEDVLKGEDNVRISDLGVAIEVGNVEHRSRWGSKKNRNKKGLSMGEFGRGTGQGQGSRRDVQEENGIQLVLKKGNGGKNGQGSGDNIGDVEAVADMGVAIEVVNVEQKGRGGYKKNRNKKGLSRCEFGRGTEQGQGNRRDVREENGIMLDLKKENGGKNGEEGTGDNVGDGEDVADMGVAIEVMNVERRSRGGYKKNRNKKGLSRSEFGRGTGLGQENGRGMGEVNATQLDMKKENGGENEEERSGDNIRDGKDVADMGVAIEVMNVEQRSRGGYNKNQNMKGLSRYEFGRGTEQGPQNGRGMGEEYVIQLDLEKENDVKNGDGRSGDNMRDGKGEAEKGPRWKEWKHNRVSGGRRNGNERMMDNTTLVYEKWFVKGDRAGAKIIQSTVEEKSKTDESVEEIPVVVSEIKENTDLCSDGSQRNDCDNTESNRMEKKENQKQELFGKHEDNGLLMTNEAYGERPRFRYKTRGNWYERFSREKTGRDFKEFSCQRVGNGRKNFQLHGQKWRFQKDPQFGDNHRNTGLVWVKKGDIADVSET